MDVIVLGAGNIGRVVVYDLVHYADVGKLAVADRSPDHINSCISLAGGGVAGLRLDACKYGELVDVIKNFDLVVNVLPGRYGFKVVKAAVEGKVDIVDVSYMPEDIFTLGADAVEAGIKVVPDAGFAPGLSNILVGHATSKMEEVNVINIYVGGLPAEPLPPLDYLVTWSVEDLLDEYIRRPRIVVGGEAMEVDALSGLERIVFPGIGVLEAFYTDGLRSLLHTIKNVDSMWEKTLRYPGHIEKMRLLRDIGLFSGEPIGGVSPRSVLVRLLEDRLGKPGADDLVAMKVYVAGYTGGNKCTYVYYLLERGVDEHGFSAMARVTGYTASILTQLVIDGFIDMAGIIPPEVIGMDEKLYRIIMGRLGERGITISESVDLD